MEFITIISHFREVIPKYKIKYGKKNWKTKSGKEKKLQQMHKKKLLREKEKTLDG